jgi:hypothetical protein
MFTFWASFDSHPVKSPPDTRNGQLPNLDGAPRRHGRFSLQRLLKSVPHRVQHRNLGANMLHQASIVGENLQRLARQRREQQWHKDGEQDRRQPTLQTGM